MRGDEPRVYNNSQLRTFLVGRLDHCHERLLDELEGIEFVMNMSCGERAIMSPTDKTDLETI